ncbi:L,D-transpeptidase [Amycolatopsis anabasis]|uniref:L,D-transpeptidase n=1 Tax=Amycolatopsis anabasis TaxID=1840409 RepID=UPI001FED1738|nr:L,D-transpeptidase [Amycolatopsis anabasis]
MGRHSKPDDHDTDLTPASATPSIPEDDSHSADPLGEHAASTGTKPSAGTPRWGRTAFVVLAGIVVLAVVVAVAASCRTAASTPPPLPDRPSPEAAEQEAIIPARPVSDAELAALPSQTTFADMPAAPQDPAPGEEPSGLVLHPRTTVPLYAAPGGPAIAGLPPRQFDADTWVPVIERQPGWDLVLLPGRPNGSSAWLFRTGSAVDEARTPYLLRLNRATFRLDVLRDGVVTHSWTVGIGKPHSPTPAGRAYILASIQDTHPTYSPLVLPLSVHSDTYLTYGGGPGTVGIHTWPTADVYGQQSSDGCIRVPGDALTLLSSEVPLGTPVLIR